MIFDTHLHLNDEKILENLDKYISEAKNAGVGRFLCIGYDVESSKKAVEIAEKYDFVYAAVGVIPTEHEQYNFENNKTLNEIEALLHLSKKVVAIGEIGLDYYWEKDEWIKEKQKRMFIEQIALANKYNLPVSIHARDSLQDTLDILKTNRVNKAGIMHCYSGSVELAREFVKLGFKIAFGGVLTFKNSRVTKEVLLDLNSSSIVFETDAPYLAPTPFRGKLNEPKFIVETVKYAANMLNISQELMEEISYKNSLEILNLK